MLDNHALLNVIIWAFTNTTSLSFAGNATTYKQNTIKLNVLVQNWPFYSLNNMLAIYFGSATNYLATSFNSFIDGAGSLKWLTVQTNILSLFIKFEDHAVVDGRNRIITYSFNETDKSIFAVLPHFWYFAEMDPKLCILLDNNSTNASANSMYIYISVAFASFVVVLLVVILLILRRQRKAKTKNAFQNLRTLSSKSDVQ